MKAFFKDIFEYHHHFNQELIKQLVTNESSLGDKVIPLLSNAINAHQIWNARITNKVQLGVHAVHTLEECIKIDYDNFLETLNILNTHALNENILYSNSKGEEFNNTVQDILFHIANHLSHHKGQIIMELRQNGINPIITDYIFYKRRTNN